MEEDKELLEGFPFMSKPENETPRNKVCRECIVSSADLSLFASKKWSEVCHGAKDILKDMAVNALRPVDDSNKGKKGPMCVLLYGAPGSGKTLRARSLGAELVQGKIDVSASRVTLVNFSCYWLQTKGLFDSADEIIAALFDVAKCLSPSYLIIEDIDCLSDASAKHFAERLASLKPITRTFAVVTTSNPWNVNKAILDSVFVDASARQLCGLPSVTERVQFLESINEFKDSGIDMRALASDDHTKGFSYADLICLLKEACFCAAHNMLLGMSKEKILETEAKDGDREIDLTEPKVSNEHVMQALKTVKPSCSDEQQVRYSTWKP